jgi:antitoxin (DNA-binding transcriptional repressor) of toxin-antitoxin stability system
MAMRRKFGVSLMKSMVAVGVSEAKNKPGMPLDRVEEGVEIITRHGTAIARLGPNVDFVDETRALQALGRIRGRVKDTKGRFDWENLKADRDAGRRRVSSGES